MTGKRYRNIETLLKEFTVPQLREFLQMLKDIENNITNIVRHKLRYKGFHKVIL